MPTITLEPGRSFNVATPKRYLNIINADGIFLIKNPQIGSVIGQVPRQYDLEEHLSVEFENDTQNPITITYENAALIITGFGGGSVSVNNAITVSEIQQFPQLDLNANIESVGITTPNQYNELPIIAIPPNSRRQIIGERDVIDRSITIQLQSVSTTTVRFGVTNDVAANSGIILTGSEKLPASNVWKNTAALHAFNTSNSEALVMCVEEYVA